MGNLDLVQDALDGGLAGFEGERRHDGDAVLAAGLILEGAEVGDGLEVPLGHAVEEGLDHDCRDGAHGREGGDAGEGVVDVGELGAEAGRFHLSAVAVLHLAEVLLDLVADLDHGGIEAYRLADDLHEPGEDDGEIALVAFDSPVEGRRPGLDGALAGLLLVAADLLGLVAVLAVVVLALGAALVRGAAGLILVPVGTLAAAGGEGLGELASQLADCLADFVADLRAHLAGDRLGLAALPTLVALGAVVAAAVVVAIPVRTIRHWLKNSQFRVCVPFNSLATQCANRVEDG